MISKQRDVVIEEAWTAFINARGAISDDCGREAIIKAVDAVLEWQAPRAQGGEAAELKGYDEACSVIGFALSDLMNSLGIDPDSWGDDAAEAAVIAGILKRFQREFEDLPFRYDPEEGEFVVTHPLEPIGTTNAQLNGAEFPGWQCFHCGEVFTTIGGARDHFGTTPEYAPGCMVRVQLGEERGLLMRVRELEAQLQAHVDPIYIEIAEERARQDVEWGGSAHDDHHSPDDWALFIRQHLSQAVPPIWRRDRYRKKMVQVAALAVAAVESHDRLTGKACQKEESSPEIPVNEESPVRDDPLNTDGCTHPDCGRFYDHNARRMSCRAMSDNACARPVREQS